MKRGVIAIPILFTNCKVIVRTVYAQISPPGIIYPLLGAPKVTCTMENAAVPYVSRFGRRRPGIELSLSTVNHSTSAPPYPQQANGSVPQQ